MLHTFSLAGVITLAGHEKITPLNNVTVFADLKKSHVVSFVVIFRICDEFRKTFVSNFSICDLN